MVLYLIQQSVTGKSYIGKTIQPLRTRWLRHCWSAKRGSRYAIHGALRKYGPDAFTITQILEATTYKELDMSERLCIAAFKAAGLELYNRTGGGEGSGTPKSADARKKISASVKASWERTPRKMSTATRQLISIAAKRYIKSHPEHFGRKAAMARWHPIPN